MHYIMNKDTPIIEIETCKIITNKMELIPYSLRLGKNLSLSVIQEWIRGRALQSNRKNSDKIYSYLGLDKYEDTLKLMYMSHSLSLTDNYWGNCTCDRCANKFGRNQLGKTLMKVREELKG